MKKFFASIAIFGMAFFAFASAALAQEQEPGADSETVSAEATEDSTVSASDLGVKDQNLLPDSPFYGFKQAWRGLKKAVTFSSEGKAKLDLQYASEKLIEVQKLAAKTGDDSAKAGVLKKAVADYQSDFDSFKNRTASLSETRKRELTSDALRLQIKQTTILDNMETQAPDDAIVAIKDAKDRAAGNMAELFGSDHEAISLSIEKLTADNSGSNFKDLKALEVLKAVEQRVPEAARAAIRQAQGNIYENFQRKLNAIPEPARAQKMQDYVKNMPGDETTRLSVLDDMKLNADLPSDVLQHMEARKPQMAERFSDRMKNVQFQETRQRFFSNLQDGDLSDARVLDELSSGSLDPQIKQEIENRSRNNLQKFRETFAGDQNAQGIADKAQALMQQVRDNPDPKTFKLLEELRNELKPEQQNFVRDLENTGREEVKQRFEQERGKFFERLNTANPEDFGALDDFQQKVGNSLPAEFNRNFDQTIRDSAQNIQDRVKEFRRPEDVQQFQDLINKEIPAGARAELQRRAPDLQRQFREHNQRIEQTEKIRFEQQQQFNQNERQPEGQRGEPGQQGESQNFNRQETKPFNPQTAPINEQRREQPQNPNPSQRPAPNQNFEPRSTPPTNPGPVGQPQGDFNPSFAPSNPGPGPAVQGALKANSAGVFEVLNVFAF